MVNRTLAMAKHKKSAKSSEKGSSKSSLPRGIDPELEKRVDALMTGQEIVEEKPEEPTQEKAERSDDSDAKDIKTDEIAGAPLLPSDKIPDFDAATEEVEPDEPLETTVEEEPEYVPEPTIRILPAEPVSTQPEDEVDPVAAALAAEPQPAVDKDELGLESSETAKAVKDIVAEEADTLLDVQDEVLPDEVPSVQKEKKSLTGKLKNFFKTWWQDPRYRWGTLIALVVAFAVLAAVPSSRYFALNTLGARSSMSIIVLDQKTSQPLKNVDVTIGGHTAKTDRDGKATLSDIKLGKRSLTVSKPAFAEINKQVTIGWGSNPFGEEKLTPVGSQYTFLLRDFLSDKPVHKDVEATSGIASALANTEGELVLTVPEDGRSEIEIEITATDYRTEKLKLPVSTKESQTLKLVPANKHVFVSKRAGVLDVYSIDVDGANEEKVLAGTGKENPDTMALVSHPSKNITAVVSTRGEAKNKDGFLLSTLTLIDLNSKKTSKVIDSERIQLIDWIDDRLVYVRIMDGESAASPNRHRLMSYDEQTGENKELAATNYFNDVMVADGAVYYTPAEYQVNGPVGLFSIKPDGSAKKTVFDREVWNMIRTSYDIISLSVGQEWHELSLASGKVTKANAAPATQRSRIYSSDPDNDRSLWIDERDGKGVLLSYNHSSKEDVTIQTQSGLKNPVYWLDSDHAVFRVRTSQEIADYVVSLSGGSPKKIKDVTDIAGIDRWYYY